MLKRWPGICVLMLFPVLAVQARPVPVDAVTVTQQQVSHSLQVTGSVTADRSARLSVAISGLVTTLNVDAGNEVASGDILLTLDPELAELQWQSAQAAVDQADNALSDARRRLREARALAPQQSIAKTAVHDLAAEVAQDEAALQRAAAEAAYRMAILKRHEMRAPFAGVISEKLTELGEWVTPGEAVLELVATDSLLLDFPVPEDYLSRVNRDTPVTLSLNALGQDQVAARIEAIVPVADENARTFLLRVRAAEGGARMIPGMSARAELLLAMGRQGLAVPRDAVIRFPDGRAVVWVVTSSSDGSLVEERRVRTGLSFNDQVEILGGLEAGDIVVVRGNEALRAGQAVDIRNKQGS